jgi:hypothetical protein
LARKLKSAHIGEALISKFITIEDYGNTEGR